MQRSEPPSAAEGTPEPAWLQSTETGNGYGSNEDFFLPADKHGSQSSTSILQRAQTVSSIISLLLSLVAIILVSIWASSLGGVSWAQGEAKRVFNWHPVMMITAYAFMNAGALAFRVSGTSSYQASSQASSSLSATSAGSKKRGIAKGFHASVWSLSFIFGIIGVLAVFKSHNDPISGYIANLYSLHSWVGIFVLSLYTLQFLIGFLAFGGLLGRGRLSSPIVMAIHKYAGAHIHFLVMTTILLGIQEKEGFVSCSYQVDSADLMPMLNYSQIPYACKISHGLGLVILFMGLCTSFSLANFPRL